MQKDRTEQEEKKRSGENEKRYDKKKYQAKCAISAQGEEGRDESEGARSFKTAKA